MSTQPIAPWIPSDDEFGARLALVRQRFAWNIKEAALACNLPAASWRGWELTGHVPRNLIEVADRIAARTGVDEYWLLTGKKNPRPADPDGGGSDLDVVPETGIEPAAFCSGGRRSIH